MANATTSRSTLMVSNIRAPRISTRVGGAAPLSIGLDATFMVESYRNPSPDATTYPARNSIRQKRAIPQVTNADGDFIGPQHPHRGQEHRAPRDNDVRAIG